MSVSSLEDLFSLPGYETAWTTLHKLSRAMVAPERSLLTGEAEVDEYEVGGLEAIRRGGRSINAAPATVTVTVEVRGQRFGRVRMQILHDASAEPLEAFVMANVAPGSVVHADGCMGYARLPKKDYKNRPRSHRVAKRESNPERSCPGSTGRSAISSPGYEAHTDPSALSICRSTWTSSSSATTAGPHPWFRFSGWLACDSITSKRSYDKSPGAECRQTQPQLTRYARSALWT